MKIGITIKGIVAAAFLSSVSTLLFGQITAPGSSYTEKTSYPSFPEQDNIYFFCGVKNSPAGELRVSTKLQGDKTFNWQKFNPVTGNFDFFYAETIPGNESSRTRLDDGCYLVEINQGPARETYRAWVMNNWYTLGGTVTESNCFSFKLTGEVKEQAPLKYYDLTTRSEIAVPKGNLTYEWKKDQTVVTRVQNPLMVEPPTKDTKYTFNITDRFGCTANTEVTYISIVTKAKFSVDPESGEAPLDVKFNNESENGDKQEYEWFVFKDLDVIKRESADSNLPYDSILIVFYDENPLYTFENSGAYQVKLVSKKVSEFHVCVDTFYLPKYIVVDTTYVEVPNVFTPNGDGTNDEFVVKFWSVLNIKISIFNRWGKIVHIWEKDNVRGFENTWQESVWDGRSGGRYASPGVYYYVVETRGRDGKNHWAKGFFHLFRGKD